MAGLIDFSLLGPGVDLSQGVNSYVNALQSKTDREFKQGQVVRQNKLDARQDKVDARDDTQRAAFAAAVDPTTGQLDPDKARLAYASTGDAKGLLAFEKDQAEARVAKRKDGIDQLGTIAQIAGSAVDQPSYDRALATAKGLGIDVSTLPPQFDPAKVQEMRLHALDAKAQLEEQHKQEQAELDKAKFGHTVENDNANLGLKRQEVGISGARLGIEGQRVGLEAQRVGIARQEAANKTAGGVGPDGEKLKLIPPSAVGGIQENITTLRKVDQAIRALKARPNSIGPGTGMLGDTFTQYNDTAGTDARARLGEVAGAKIHDLSGAAVSASEAPRFTPYIPAITDKPEVALKKLQNFRDQLQSQVGEQQAYYAPQNGYRPYKGAETPARSAPKSAPAASPAPSKVIKYDARGNRVG